MPRVKKQKVLVAMSGGVDSSVAAALLKRAGFDVAGAFIYCWEDRGGQCSGFEDEAAARSAARTLNVPFYTFDFRKEYKKRVFDYFISEYKAGRTPNPDVMCNKYIKFGLFLKKALALGFDKIATGHYARLRRETPNSKPETLNGFDKLTVPSKSRDKHKTQNPKLKKTRLLRGIDDNKDQSYFLWQLSQDQLQHCLFPIGDYTKPEVRKMAKKFGLPNAERKDSQGICFVGKIKTPDFLKKYIKQKKGKIINSKGELLGYHPGVYFYTIGQRKGLRLSGGPYWVAEKKIRDNILVAASNEKELNKKKLVAGNIHWISGKSPRLPIKIKASFRYRQKPVTAIVSKDTEVGTYKLKFNAPQHAIASGQSVVFYRGQDILGGGIIV